MWFYGLFALVLIGVMTPIWLGILPPRNARCVIRIRKGKVSVQGDTLPHHVQSSVFEILQAVGVNRGFIAIFPEARVKFSCQIPETLHQRLRNVRLNP